MSFTTKHLKDRIDKLHGPEKFDRRSQLKCRICGCTETEPCNPPCSWARDGRGDICSTCDQAADQVAEWMSEAHNARPFKLLREALMRHTHGPQQSEVQRVLRQMNGKGTR